MPKYNYIAIDAGGVRVSGAIDATDPDAAVSRLTADGLRIESVLSATAISPAILEGGPPSRLGAGETREISGHIAEIVSGGLPLEGGLAAIAEEFPRGRMSRALRRLVRRLESGSDLESALAASGAPTYLSPLVRAGTRSGRTAEILDNFVAGSQVVSDLRQTLWMALAYPLILLCLLLPMGYFLVSRIVPDFAAIFDGFDVRLPWMTQVLLISSRFTTEHGLRALVGLTAGIVLLYLLIRLTLGAAGTRRLVCAIPVLGALVRWLALARFSPILSLLIEGRVPLDEALVLAAEASGDAEIIDDCRGMATKLQAGKTLESAAREMGRFPQSFVRALSWERHQEGFSEALQSMAEMYAWRARALATVLIAVLPALIVSLLTLIIGFVVVGLFMPLIELLNKLS